MAEVKGRCWPHDLPFSGGINGEDNKPYVTETGFVCDNRPGDFAFKDFDAHGTNDPAKVDNLEFVCPRTGKYCGSIIVGHQVKPPEPAGHTWKWDGNFEEPTLEPSINCISGCGWHGWLQKGIWRD